MPERMPKNIPNANNTPKLTVYRVFMALETTSKVLGERKSGGAFIRGRVFIKGSMVCIRETFYAYI